MRRLLTVAVSGLVAISLASPVAAHTASARTGSRSAPGDLAQALDPEGNFVGNVDVTGRVDTSAWQLTSDLSAGEPPTLAPAATALPESAPAWSALGSDGAGNGPLNFATQAIAVMGTDLFVGGQFTDAGGIATADYIARWNGTNWSALGSNGAGDGALNGYVLDLEVSGTDLYVGGSFRDAGGVTSADRIARWDGNNWFALGSNGASDGAVGGPAYVREMAVSGNDVYASGWFLNAAGIAAADHIAHWNGSVWSALGSNGAGDGALNDAAEGALTLSGSVLYVGGAFTNAAGIATADHLARWDGSSWSGLGSNGAGDGALNESVNQIVVSGNTLYIGGIFTNAAGNGRADYVAQWNGSTWKALGSNGHGDGALNDGIAALALWGGNVYVGGYFNNCGTGADWLARWNGTSWADVGFNDFCGGQQHVVLALTVMGDHLYAGGSFDAAGDTPLADDIAAYGPLPSYQPDPSIRKGSKPFIGNDIYNTDGTNQTRTASAGVGSKITFDVSIENDGLNPDRFKVWATGIAMSGYDVKYFRGRTNITAAVIAGTYLTRSLAPGDAVSIRARVTIQPGAAIESSISRLLKVTSTGNTSKLDVVQFVASRS
jgi:hypothetical protein